MVLGAHSLIVAAKNQYDEGDDEDEDVEEEDEEETNTFGSYSIDMEQSVYDWIFFSALHNDDDDDFDYVKKHVERGGIHNDSFTNNA